MDSEAAFRARLRAAIADVVSSHETRFETPCGELADGGLLVPAAERDGIVLETTAADVDPHSPTAIRRGKRRAREHGTSAFVTANETDAFLFCGAETDADTPVANFDRRWYDLRSSTLAEFGERVLDDAVALRDGDESPTRYEEFVVGRLRSFHASLCPRYESSVRDAFAEDERFRDSLVSWARENGYPVAEPDVVRTIRIAARLSAYLMMARVVFAERYRESDADETRAIGALLAGRTNVGLDGTELFDAVPTDAGTKERVRAFADSIEREPLSEVDIDIAGRVYERLIPDDERTRLGQFYTPDEIGRLLSRWAIRSPGDRVLDPASGTGSLTVHAYDRLDELGARSHREPLERLTAVDVDGFSLRLLALTLAFRDGHDPADGPFADDRFAYHRDFFDLDPDTVGRFDATVANPPYVRQECLAADRGHFREHLTALGPGSDGIYADGEKEIDGRSDLYCYFLTHATSFLREGARLAWVVPTKWMVADYGPSLQRFLYDHYKVEAVVGFRNRLFDDALVDTVLLLLERTDDEAVRRATETNFVRINERMDSDDILDVIDRTYDFEDGDHLTVRGESSHRVVAVRQSHLSDHLGEKLHRYITAPALHTAVVEHDATVPLSEVATITRGKKTGANPIFVLDADDVRSREVEERFLRPAIKSVREIDGYEYTTDDAEKWMLDVADYAERVLSDADVADVGVNGNTDSDTDAADRAAFVTSALDRDGYSGVSSYLRWAETHPSRTNASLANNDPWFDMGSLDSKTAPIVCPQAMDTRRFFARTDGEVVASNRFLLVRPQTVDSTLLLGLLNASLTKIVVESHGRVTGGGAVNLSSSDLRTLRVVDPSSLTDEQRTTVRDGFESLVAGDGDGQNAIDGAVIDALDLDLTVDELQEVARTLKRIRRTKGREVESPVRKLDALEDHIEIGLGE
ncbi:N-6 DNA methylase (plasmid) [Haladaptatus sp. SPP-AMP-3]|uniref:HsdM family class I SAM-dependent methyltransferase n=1 Tax=Haladaptatus sp. SPP-AMP-3 TaxID=3121295 RepID=UPI003C2F988B